eukprot:5795514-Amphidinium_carterae.1
MPSTAAVMVRLTDLRSWRWLVSVGGKMGALFWPDMQGDPYDFEEEDRGALASASKTTQSHLEDGVALASSQ